MLYMIIRMSQQNIFFLMKRRNLFLWYLGVGLKDPKRIFDMVKFWEVQKAVKNLTIIIKKRSNLPRRQNCSGVMFLLILVVFQSCKFNGNMSPKKESILESRKREMKNLEKSRRLSK